MIIALLLGGAALAAPVSLAPQPGEEVATFGGGCFWCMEAIFKQLIGVHRVLQGYAGGHVPNPTYEQVCTETTGHAECIQVYFDPKQISYSDLLDVYFHTIDPTTLNRQGNDVGESYRSIILFRTPAQKNAAVAAMRQAQPRFTHPIVTQLQPFTAFYPAEEYHRDYYARHPDSGYCRYVIAPEVARFKKAYRNKLKTPGK
ncbi:MAG: peptide-methionine (S)-S-oxide reductase MsrA [Candidatus Xenobia bacterium]